MKVTLSDLSANLPRISFSLRAFAVYFVVLATLSWFILDEAIERFNITLRQSAESVLVDTANLLATTLEQEFTDQILDTGKIERLFTDAYQRQLNAQIYSVLKERIDTEVYITDKSGTVVFDSSGENVGKDYSLWRDVRLTLAGEYGARTSYRYEDRTEDDDPKIMVIGAPIYFQQDIVGVVSVVKPVRILEAFLLEQSTQLKKYAIGLLALAMLMGYLVSYGFTRAINKLATYANKMAAGQKVTRPKFLDKRFYKLAGAITYLREQVDGKEYVENYVHSLTHELKTPITSIKAAAELLEEDLPEKQRKQFLDNIHSSNERMSRLVDRMLELAKLEGLPQINKQIEFDVVASIKQLVDERSLLIDQKIAQVHYSPAEPLMVKGDSLLIGQAIANLLDNALHYSGPNEEIEISAKAENEGYRITVCNKGSKVSNLVIDKAFDRFFSLPTGEQRTKSTGLGLSFVREIMKLHNGETELANTPLGVVGSIHWSSTG
jgi:two-component system sensor histidine kinase CreC